MFQIPKQSTPEEIGVTYDQVGRFFEFIWGESLHVGYWPRGTRGGTLAEAQERFTELLISKSGMKAGQSFLDVGCGTGRPGVHIAQATGCKVTGITVSRTQVEAGNQRAAAAGVQDRVAFLLADAMKMPFPDASFDGAWAFESLHHMPDRNQVLRELHRVLRPGGRLVIADLTLGGEPPAQGAALLSEFWKINSLLTPEQSRALLPQEGFELVEWLDVTPDVLETGPMGVENMHKRSEEIRRVYGDEFLGMMRTLMPQISQLSQQYVSYAVISGRKR